MVEKFIIIGRSNCHFSTQAVDYCLCLSVEHQFLDYVSQPDILEDYKEFYKQPTVPIILSNDLETGIVKKVGGCTELIEYLS